MYRTSEKTSLSRKMAELEDRWRKSQEDRYVLELKFKEVLKGLASKNEGNKLLKIKEKYNRFLENEDARNERNDRILRTLDKIESQASMLSAKTERLKLLKLHYEAYMKRMYPTWEKEVNCGEIFSNKSPVYLGSLKLGHSNTAFGNTRDEVALKNNYLSAPYCPRPSETLHANPNVSRSALINGQSEQALSNYHFGELPRNGVRSLNREFSGAGMDSVDKTSSSLGPSFEQEENTSKDLLNVSLSDDNVVNENTVPVDTDKARKGQTDVAFQLNQRPTGDEVDIISLQANPMNRQKSENSLSNHNRVSLVNDNGDIINTGEQLDARESQLVWENTSELQPSVVVTPSEDDVVDEGAKAEDKISTRCESIPSHETSGLSSEAEASEVDGIAREVGEDNMNNAQEEADAEPSPRPSTSYGNNQGNFEEPFQLSSSDADYDELENQMAALVEGRREDENKSEPPRQSGYESPSNSDHVDSESAEASNIMGGNTVISSVSAEEEMSQLKGCDDDEQGVDRGNSYMESNTFSEKEEDAFMAQELVEESERDDETYNPIQGEEIIKDGEASNNRHEIQGENINARQASEKYDDQNTVKCEALGFEGVETEGEDQYYGAPENLTENYLSESNGRGIYNQDGGVQSIEGSETDHGDDKRYAEMSGLASEHSSDRNVDFPVEQDTRDSIHLENIEGQSNYVTDEREEGNEVEDSEGYIHDGGTRDDETVNAPQYESQEETWLENEDKVESLVHEGYDQPQEVQVKMEVEANDEYNPEQEEVEQSYGDQVTEGANDLQEIVNKNDDEVQEGYETGEIQPVEGVKHEYVREEIGEMQDEGEGAERRVFERDAEGVTQEGYGNDVVEENIALANEENYVQGEVEQVTGECTDGDSDKTVREASGNPDENHGQELNLPLDDQEKGQYDADMHVGGKIMGEANLHKKGKDDISENNVRATIDEVGQPEIKLREQNSIEKVDVTENVEANPETVNVEGFREVKQEESRLQHLGEKELHDVSDAAVEREIEKINPEEVRAVSHKTTKKDEAHAGKPVRGAQKEKESARKDTEHHVTEKAEKSPKETPQVPSRPQSRQSGRKEGSSPDTYKGEKLKTAIRKFQAKKDTRQPTRRSTDSKK